MVEFSLAAVAGLDPLVHVHFCRKVHLAGDVLLLASMRRVSNGSIRVLEKSLTI